MKHHPFKNPLFDKADYARSIVGNSAATVFQMLIDEGGSHQDVVEMARQLQGAIGRAAKGVLVHDANSHIVPDPPEFGSGLGHTTGAAPEPESEATPQPKNPFEDLP